jgi:hypothetical protein
MCYSKGTAVSSRGLHFLILSCALLNVHVTQKAKHKQRNIEGNERLHVSARLVLTAALRCSNWAGATGGWHFFFVTNAV